MQVISICLSLCIKLHLIHNMFSVCSYPEQCVTAMICNFNFVLLFSLCHLQHALNLKPNLFKYHRHYSWR